MQLMHVNTNAQVTSTKATCNGSCRVTYERWSGWGE